MYKISDEQVDFILDDIAKKGIETEDVRFNILDHVCCILENEMSNEMNFKKFYEDTIARFYKHELKEIEDETRQLITFKYYHAMKRTVKIAGFASVLLILLGSVLKVQHLPGAGISLVVGFTIFCLLFIPLNIIMKFRDDKEKYNRLVMTLGMSLVFTGTFGMLFKVMHWPFANMLFFGSLALFGIVFIPIYFFTNYRKPETKFNAVIHSTFMIAAAGMMFALINLGPKKHNIEDVKSAQVEFELEAIDDYGAINEALYSEIEKQSSEKVKSYKIASADLWKCVEGIERNQISKSNNIGIEAAEKLNRNDLNNPNDYIVVNTHFVNSQKDYSFAHLEQSVLNYNKAISALDDAKVIRKINIEKLKFSDMNIENLLANMSDIKIQVLANENSFLSYQKGLIANNQ